jgi:hypothetical protein
VGIAIVLPGAEPEGGGALAARCRVIIAADSGRRHR